MCPSHYGKICYFKLTGRSIFIYRMNVIPDMKEDYKRVLEREVIRSVTTCEID